MSRHRNVRKMSLDDECDYDDYGRSVEEEYCISPGTAAEFMFDRSSNRHEISDFFKESDIAEEEHESEEGQNLPQLSQVEEAKLRSCLDEIRNVVGENFTESVLVNAILAHKFEVEKALDAVLSKKFEPEPPRPQRQRRERNIVSSRQAEDVTPSVVVTKSDNAPLADRGIERVRPSVTKHTVQSGSSTPVQRGFTPDETENEKDTIRTTTTNRAELAGSASPNMSTQKNYQRFAGAATSSGPKIDAQREYAKHRGGGKELLNLVVIGHVDAGKSTLMGHLLVLLEAVSKKLMHKYEQESKKIGKASFLYAWVLDETGEERSRGITMDVAQFKFETDSKIITLLDAPGHKDFIPNMITGASQADVALLVVDASRGEFETGFESGGQTREHALLVRSLGVSQLVVVVNKLDNVNWSQDRFTDISKKLGQFLKQAGFKDADVSYIPCSGMTGENLIELPKVPAFSQWYKGPTLLKQIDNFRSPERPVSKPFRLTVTDLFKSHGSGFSIAGRVETGVVQTGDKVLVMPQGELASVKCISADDLPIPIAFAGDQVVVTVSNIDMVNVTVGSILCDPSQPIKSTTTIQARIVVFNIDIPITKGFQVEYHYQSLSEPAVIKKLVSQLHKSTGEVIKKKPKCLTKQSSAVIVVEVNRPVCVELYKDIKELGRFMLRYGGSTIAAGLVTEIL